MLLGERTKRIEALWIDFEKQPPANLFGILLSELEKGKAKVIARVTAPMLVTAGMVQGGITLVIADFAGVYAAMSAIGSGHTPLACVTGEYFSPIKEGEDVRASASVINESDRYLMVFVEVFSGNRSQEEKKAHFTMRFAKPKP